MPHERGRSRHTNKLAPSQGRSEFSYFETDNYNFSKNSHAEQEI